MQEVKGNIAERVASAFNDRDPRMKRWACMSAERRRQYVLRWERRLQAIRDAGFEVVEAAEIERLAMDAKRLAMDAKSLEGIIDSLERRMDGPNGLLAKVENLTRERDEARAEVERLKSEPETLRAELIAICNASRAALANAYDRARGSRKALEAKP